MDSVEVLLVHERTEMTIFSMKISRDDGRIQQPLILVFFSPISCNTKLRMLYSRLMRLLLPYCDQLKIVKSNRLTRGSLEGNVGIYLPPPTWLMKKFSDLKSP